MPDYEMLFPGRFLKKTDLAKPTTIRIVEVTAADIATDEPGSDGKKEKAKGLLRFRARPGDLGGYTGDELILCKTNAALIAAALGDRDFDAWKGRLITIHHDPAVSFGREKTGGIRVCGSPELQAEKRVEIKMPRKTRPEVYVLKPTGKAPSSTQPTEQPQAGGEQEREAGQEG